MPIKPENLHRYPADWPEIRKAILARARYRCEWPGCGAPHRTLGYWQGSCFIPMPTALRLAGAKRGYVIECSDGSTIKLILLVLTIAHLNHVPEDCRPENLAAWCQRHHLAYDADHHKITAYMTRKASANTLELPL